MAKQYRLDIAAYNHGFCFLLARPEVIGHIDKLNAQALDFYPKSESKRASFESGWMLALGEVNAGQIAPAKRKG